MHIDLKHYQQNAVDGLLHACNKLLARTERGSRCIFQAPTGSGKTLMAAKFIERLVNESPELDVCFLWMSIGTGELHLQSKHSLQKIFSGSPKVTQAENEFSGGRDIIRRSEVVVANWEKLRTRDRKTGEWKGTMMKDSEKNNFRDVLENTRRRRQIILLIDESHTTSKAQRTSELRKEIDADMVVEMSATPSDLPSRKDIVSGKAAYIFVEAKDVIDEGMIKQELLINPDIKDEFIKDDEIDSQKLVMQIALRKREELVKLFQQEGTHINPLVLVQIPTAAAGTEKMKFVKEFLKDRGITEENGKLAIWLSEQKSETLDSVAEANDRLEFLIFKQAICTGWDCPRAHVLVKFRESKSETFEIQTVGRILRTPEQKHYASADLNRGFIYTNVQSILVKKEDYNPNIIKHLKAELRKKVAQPLRLTSYYKSRTDYGDITASFSPVFTDKANAHFGLKDSYLSHESAKKLIKKGLNLKVESRRDMVAEGEVSTENFDAREGEIDAPSIKVKKSDADIQAEFEQVIKENLGSFTNIKRSLPAVKTAIYSWFTRYIGTKNLAEVQKICTEEGNREQVEEILAEAVAKYKLVRDEEVQQRIKESEQVYDFELPEVVFHNQHNEEKVMLNHYAYEPCFLHTNRSQPEKDFEEFLSKEKNITWWWKNGEGKREFFGIRYEYPKGQVRIFYPDYLVCTKSGKLGILEIKHDKDRDGKTKTKAKAETLQKFIAKEKNRKLFGGVAIYQNRAWKINSRAVYNWDKCEEGDWGEWGKLELC